MEEETVHADAILRRILFLRQARHAPPCFRSG
jgi:bacterioferritin (cytochrome b1)